MKLPTFAVSGHTSMEIYPFNPGSPTRNSLRPQLSLSQNVRYTATSTEAKTTHQKANIRNGLQLIKKLQSHVRSQYVVLSWRKCFLQILVDSSIWIRLRWLKISFRESQGKKQIYTLKRLKLRIGSKKSIRNVTYLVGTVVITVSSLIQFTIGLRTFISNSCYCVAGTDVAYIHFYFYTFYLRRETMDAPGVMTLLLW
jgi:hypothetical protein